MEPVTIRLGGRFQPNQASLVAVPASLPIFFDVPEKKRLTIEAFSGDAFFPKGQGASIRILAMNPKGKPALPPLAYQVPLYHQAFINPDPSNPNAELRDIWAMDHSLRGYVDPGMRLQLDGFRGHFQPGIGGAEVVITGFFEDVV